MGGQHREAGERQPVVTAGKMNQTNPVDQVDQVDQVNPTRTDLSIRMPFDYLIVGAGFAGSVLAERLASQVGKTVLICDRRPHIAGNAYDHYDEAGVLVHKYGPHIFHTNSARVFQYLSQFTSWRPYEHRVRARVDSKLYPMPINRDTVNQLYGLNLEDEAACAAFYASVAEKVAQVRNSEDVVVGKVGRDLYEKFCRRYTRRHWGLDPSALDPSVLARVPARTNTDDRYFTDTYQFMPLHGYTRMFEHMLAHPHIKILLNTDYREILGLIRFKHLIYTGPVDEFFEYRFGKLPYLSLRFEHETHNVPVYQPAPVINDCYPGDTPYDRVTEFKYLTGQEHPKTSIVYEYPFYGGDPYYPVPRSENHEIYRQYKELVDDTPNIHFVGRLATYKYYNMDQVTAQALTLFDELMGVRSKEVRAATSAGANGKVVGFSNVVANRDSAASHERSASLARCTSGGVATAITRSAITRSQHVNGQSRA